MTNFEFTSHKYEEDQEVTIRAYQNGEQLGYINYGPNEEDPSSIAINMLTAKFPRQGIGTALIRQMVRTIGPAIPIRSVIIEKETIRALQNPVFLERARSTGSIEITDRDVLDQLLIVKLHEKGGIETSRVRVLFEPNDEESPFVFVHEGVTTDLTDRA